MSVRLEPTTATHTQPAPIQPATLNANVPQGGLGMASSARVRLLIQTQAAGLTLDCCLQSMHYNTLNELNIFYFFSMTKTSFTAKFMHSTDLMSKNRIQ